MQRDASEDSGLFPPTQWSLLCRAAAAGEETDCAAWEKLGKDYWHPLYVLLRMEGLDREDAEDVVQNFFASLLSTPEKLQRLNREKGRLRDWLKAAVRNHRITAFRAASAKKRGGHAKRLALDAAGAEREVEQINATGLSPDAAYDQAWANRLLAAAFADVEEAYTRRGQVDRFMTLRDALASGGVGDLGASLNLSSGAGHKAMFDFKRALRAAIRARVATTVVSSREEDVDEELAAMLKFFGT